MVDVNMMELSVAENHVNIDDTGSIGNRCLAVGDHSADSTTSGSVHDYHDTNQADPSVPSPDGVCHFWGLSGELRNLCYQYALSEPEGLFYHPSSANVETNTFPMFASLDAATDDTAMESNQLKYVCRQLKHETSGLGIKFNDLTFACLPSFPDQSLSVYFQDFINSCAPKRLDGPRKVVLRDHNPWVPSVFDGDMDSKRGILRKFLTTHPRTTVHVHMAANVNTYLALFICGCVCQYRDRGRDLYQLILDDWVRVAIISRAAEHREESVALEDLNLPNRELWPPVTMRFDEEAIHEELANGSGTWVSTAINGGFDTLVAELKKWFEQGILSGL